MVDARPAAATDVRFAVERTFAVRGRLIEGSGKAHSSWLGVWAALEEAGISMDILCIVLMIPFGAVVSVVMRNILGLRTFGFFLPMLIAIGATRTGLGWAIAAFLFVIGAVYLFRLVAEPLRLLHFPRLAVILTSTVLAIIGPAAEGALTGNVNLAHVTFLPIVALTIATEQFSTIIEEEGSLEVLKVTGANLGPQEAWLVLRGLRTLTLRVRRQCENGLSIARWLVDHPKVARVLYPGLPSHPQHELASALFGERGYGGMISFELAGARQEDVFRFFEALRLCLPATTLGDVCTLVLYPAHSSHRAVSPGERARIGIGDGLVRMSVGIEAVEDLVDDLAQALSVV